MDTKLRSSRAYKRQYSLCISNTLVKNCVKYNIEQITHICYQIARAASLYNVVELVVMDTEDEAESGDKTNPGEFKEVGPKGQKKIKFDEILEPKGTSSVEESQHKPPVYSPECMIILVLLQFFVTPPYLVKSIFTKEQQKYLKYAKKLPMIPTLPFMQNGEVHATYKEGLSVPQYSSTIHVKRWKTPDGKIKKRKRGSNNLKTRFVNIGRDTLFELEKGQEVPMNVRVTVDLKNKTVVSPLDAYGITGLKSSFGYSVRAVKEFHQIYTESGNPDGYSRSCFVEAGDFFVNQSHTQDHNMEKLPIIDNSEEFKDGQEHLLVVITRWKELQEFFKADNSEMLKEIETCESMFDNRLEIINGTKVEDAVLIALAKLES
ncbi:BA75_03971T0 [Komagataella pastoris]|uniref:BA75_03971T0 n=1 Tax=Komagataella pastoris TaxID=4922 RepID=A0A1B2JEF9_PICPA|nr:BA75_03971T0 [Komagataella pastoris]